MYRLEFGPGARGQISPCPCTEQPRRRILTSLTTFSPSVLRPVAKYVIKAAESTPFISQLKDDRKVTAIAVFSGGFARCLFEMACDMASHRATQLLLYLMRQKSIRRNLRGNLGKLKI